METTTRQSDCSTSDNQEFLKDLLHATAMANESVAQRFGVPGPTLAERANDDMSAEAAEEKKKISRKAEDNTTITPKAEVQDDNQAAKVPELPTQVQEVKQEPELQADKATENMMPKTVLQQEISIPHPPPSNENQDSTPCSVPGAHAVGGFRFTNRPSPWLQMLSPPPLDTSDPASAEDPPSSGTTEDDPPETRDSNAGLVRANPIMDGSSQHFKNVSQQAQEVDPEANAKRQAAKEQQTRNMVLVGGTMLLLIVVVAAVLIWRLQEQNEQLPTGMPSLQPSRAPSITPSTAPSSLLDSWTQELLPQDSITSILEDPASPQALAYHWLLTHRDIATMEPWRKLQLYALATFYYAFEGPHWPTPIAGDWLNDEKHECFWFHNSYGSFVELAEDGQTFLVQGMPYTEGNTANPFLALNDTQCNEKMEVQSIALTGLQLGHHNPYIPPQVALLTSLTSILLDANDAIHVGERQFIPSEIGRLSHLQFFRLWGNRVEGTIPTEFGLLTKLSTLDFDSNSFYGTIPSELFQLRELTDLWLNSNDLTGTIPSDIGNLQALSLLEVSGNRLSGSLPSQVGQMKGMKYLSLFNNLLSGRIPTETAEIPGLEILFINRNQLSGPIPSQFGNISSIWILELGSNQLTGTIPSEIGMLSSAMQIGLDNNGLIGSIPTQVGAMALLQSLDLANNDLWGPMPSTELAGLAAIRRLGVSGNSLLKGTIPGRLCALNQNLSCSYRHWRAVGGHMARSMNCSMDFDCTSTLCGCSCSCNQSTLGG